MGEPASTHAAVRPVTRPRLLIAVSYGLSVRYLLPTGLLARIAERFEPIVATGWDDPELEAALRHRGAETCRLPTPLLDDHARRERRRIRVLHERWLASPSSRIQRWERRTTGTDRLLVESRRLQNQLAALRSGGRDRALSDLSHAIGAGANVDAYHDLLERSNAQAVLSFTPYHDDDGLLLFAAERRETPTAVSLISWDNPTTRARWLALPSFVMVWNERNARELGRAYPELATSITVTGAPQFDLHHRADLIMDEGLWRKELQLPRDRRILLYNAGPEMLVPDEPELVATIDEALANGRLPSDLHLLVRRHPADSSDRWRTVSDRLRHTTLTAAWHERPAVFRSWPTDSDLELQMSSFAHSLVHLSVCSSTSLDGAVFGRPQICPAFVPGTTRRVGRRIAELYDQEHWAPIAESGGAQPIDDEAALWAAIERALDDPEATGPARQRMLATVLTHPEGGSSERVASALAGWAAETIR